MRRSMRRSVGLATYRDLTQEERIAVVNFASDHGRLWKARLSELWVRAAAEPTLHQLRNTHGPDWLYRLDLERLAAMGVVDCQETAAAELEEAVADAVAAEVRTLRKAGYSKAYICERSHEIEGRVRNRIEREQAETRPVSK